MKKNIKRGLSALLLSLAVFILLMLLVYLQALFTVKKQTENNLSAAVSHLDEMLQRTNASLLKAGQYTGAVCDKETLDELRVLVAKAPGTRSIELVRNGHIYCSSVFGRTPDATQTYSGQRLSVYTSEITNPGVPFLALQHVRSGSNNSVVATVDGYYIFDFLATSGTNFPLYLQVGDKIVSPLTKKIEVNTINPVQYDYFLQMESERENYAVYSGYSNRDVLLYLVKNWLTVLFVVLVISVISGVTLFLFQRKEKPSREQLRMALRKNEIVPWIQPVFNKDGEMQGGEILARWQHPEKGLISPLQFIPLAEENNLIIPLTRSLFQQVQAQLRDVWETLPEGTHLAFNISPDYLQDKTLIKDVEAFLLGFGVKKPNLVLEITERQPLTDTVSLDVIHQLRSKGVKFALDDFGTGYSNLSYLKHYHFDFIKIDKSFVQDLAEKTHVGSLVANIVKLTESVNAKSIAEGIETPEQFEELKSLSVDYYQGYLFSKPLPLEEFKQKKWNFS